MSRLVRWFGFGCSVLFALSTSSTFAQRELKASRDIPMRSNASYSGFSKNERVANKLELAQEHCRRHDCHR